MDWAPTSLRGVITLAVIILAIVLYVYAATTMAALVGIVIILIAGYVLYLAVYRVDNYLKNGL